MADPLTPNVGLAVPIRGSDVGTWDIPVNGDFTLIDSMLGGVTTIAVSSINVTLATSQAQNSIIRLTGTISSPSGSGGNSVVITLPAINKGWTIDNQITNSPSSFAAILNVPGNNLGIPPGVQDILYDGTSLKWRNLGKVGELWDYAGSGPPTWTTAGYNTVQPYLNCDGTTFSSAVYPVLANILGGNTLPDSRGRTRVALNQGSSRMTSSGGGVDGNTNLASGGTENKTIGLTQVPGGITSVNSSLGIVVGNTNTVGFPIIPVAAGGTGPISQVQVTTGTFGVGQTPYATNAGAGSAGIWSQTTFMSGSTVTVNNTGAAGTGVGTAAPTAVVQPTYVGGITLIRAN